MKGIITIAVGDRNYGNMAFNLAMSIRHNSRVDMCIIYTPSAFKGAEYLLDIFTHKVEVPDTDEPVKLAMKLKTRLNVYTPYSRTIFLDSDCIMTPTHCADEWFDELAGVPFTAYNNAIYELGGNPYPYYKCWAKPDDIRAKYGFKKTDKIPQINSSFIYWEQTEESSQIFSVAYYTMTLDRGIVHESFRGAFPDELAFNISCALNDMMPHKETYRPIYLYILSETVSKEYIIENFPALSIIGNDIKDTRIYSYYNDFVEYYADMGGYKDKFLYKPKQVKQNRRIFGYYHVCAINGYEEVVKEQIADLINSGLYRAAERIVVGVSGEYREDAIKLFSKYKKFYKFLADDNYEFPTLEELQRLCESDEKSWVFYIHTKGVSYLDGRGDYWRQYMMYYNVHKWKDCVAKLRDGHETCGVKLLEAKSHHPKHYSGNFWWATSEYIKRLPKVTELNQQDRFQAEFWVCSGSPNAATLSQLMVDYENKPNYKL